MEQPIKSQEEYTLALAFLVKALPIVSRIEAMLAAHDARQELLTEKIKQYEAAPQK